jgi:hypothetical protein
VREAEESPLLEAVARECLVITQQAGRDLVGAVVICELWRLVVELIPLIVTPSRDNWCQKWLDWKLHWIFIVIPPYYANGTNDGMSDSRHRRA